jgi:hypothetical protein
MNKTFLILLLAQVEYSEARFIPFKRKQKYQNGNIHRKLKVPTSEREGKLSNPRVRAARTPCREKIYENLRKPARARCARVMH